jgi:hypothetical protein
VHLKVREAVAVTSGGAEPWYKLPKFRVALVVVKEQVARTLAWTLTVAVPPANPGGVEIKPWRATPNRATKASPVRATLVLRVHVSFTMNLHTV